MDHGLLHLTDAELLSRVASLRGRERTLTVEVIAHLAEIDRRGLHLAEGFSSLFAYCQSRLGYSEHECYGRIEAARCARDYPRVLDLLLDGSITMSVVALLRPHLTAGNHVAVLAEAHGKTKREVEEIVVRLRPKAEAPPALRRLPPPTVVARALPAPARPAPPPVPVAPERFRYSVTIDSEARDLLKRAKELSPSDDETLLKRALELLVADLERRKNAATQRPTAPRPTHPDSRHVPAEVKRAVAARDGGQCAYVSPTGQRCAERRWLEFHHRVPYAAGGPMSVDNIALRCRAHNAYEGRLFFARSAEGAPQTTRSGPSPEVTT